MDMGKGLLLNLYRDMLRIRICEESLIEPILNGKIKTPCHLYSGQEAISASICANLNETDIIFGNHRSHGHYLSKGGDLDAMIAEIYTRDAGCSRGRGGSMHLIDATVGVMGTAPIVAGTISLAVGAALAAHIRNNQSVAVSFFGDGATGEGVFYESLNLAALWKLPTVFVCENNCYATHMPINRCRPNRKIADIAKALGIKNITVDGNDVEDVYELAKQAINECRHGRGPFFIEAMTYRLRGHVGPDDNIQGTHTEIRPAEEIEKWQRRDPIVFCQKVLLKKYEVSQAALDEIKTEITNEINAAHIKAESCSDPLESELGINVFK